MIKKILASIAIIAAILGTVFSYNAALATEDACEIAGFDDPLICGTANSNEEAELQNRVKSTLNTIYLWIGIIAVIVIVIGGVKYMTATGDSQKIQSAKNTIMYAVIGLVVTLLAFAITNTILNSLEGQAPSTGSQPTTPTTDPSAPVAVKAVNLSGASTVKLGDKSYLQAKVIPDYATNRTITWQSSNPNVATVDTKGYITPKNPGTTTITATADKISSSKEITVLEPIKAKSIKLNPTSLSIAPKKTKTFTVTWDPANTEDKTLKWTSSNTAVATVDNNGKVTAIKEGSATITATTTNNVSATAKVTVAEGLSGNDTGERCIAETGRGMCKATNISIKFGSPKDSKGRCGKGKNDHCAAIATVTYPKGTIQYYIGYQNNSGLLGGSCRSHAFMAAANATTNSYNSTLDLQKHLQSKNINGGVLRGSKAYKEVISHFKVKAKAYFGETSAKESKRLAKIALNNGQPVAMFVAHGSCPKLAGSHHALLLLGYDKQGMVQFIDSVPYAKTQTGKYSIDKLFDTCMSGTGTRNSWMGMQIFEF